MQTLVKHFNKATGGSYRLSDLNDTSSGVVVTSEQIAKLVAIGYTPDEVEPELTIYTNGGDYCFVLTGDTIRIIPT